MSLNYKILSSGNEIPVIAKIIKQIKIKSGLLGEKKSVEKESLRLSKDMNPKITNRINIMTENELFEKSGAFLSMFDGKVLNNVQKGDTIYALN